MVSEFTLLNIEIGTRATKALISEYSVSQSRNAANMMSLLIAKRIRARNIREGVTNSDPRDLPAVPVPRRALAPVGPARFYRTAGNSSL